MRLIAYQNGDRRVMARVADDMALPFARLEDFWADPQQSLLAAVKARSGGEPVASLVQVPPLPDTARVICAGLNYAAHAEEAHFKLPTKPDIFGRWRSTLAVDGQPVQDLRFVPDPASFSGTPAPTCAATDGAWDGS